jgi:hypothetical protein
VKIRDIPKKIYDLQISNIKLVEDISEEKLKKKHYCDKVMLIITQEVDNEGKKAYKNQNEREAEFAQRLLMDNEFNKLDTELRTKEIRMKKEKFLIEYYSNVLKILPFKDVELEEIDDGDNHYGLE